ncbi:hypothetical protein IG631_05461 [Alternaria alternata]|nr:hypothetical protein IG631_05461 [Alternaria alternata]
MVLCNVCAAEKSKSDAESSHPRALASHPPTPTQLRGYLQPSKERELSIIEEARVESLKAESLKTGPPSPRSPETATAPENQPRERKSRHPKMSIPPQLQQQLRLLIRANHILHHHGLVDAFGHISVRHPLNKEQYIIAAYDPGAPALVKNMSDFISYWVKDSAPVDPDAPQGYSERYIHGEILRRFPKVNCVVHSHSEDVIPFTVGHGAREPHPVRPVFHMAGFLGQGGASVFTMDSLYGTARAPSEHDLLIKNATLGAALAARFSPENPVVLQHKHGFTTFGASIEEAVYRAIYTQKNCILLQRAIAIAGGDAEAVSYLSAQEIKDCAIMNKKTLDKSFRLWVREVQVNTLYENEEGEPEKGKVAGMKM